MTEAKYDQWLDYLRGLDPKQIDQTVGVVIQVGRKFHAPAGAEQRLPDCGVCVGAHYHAFCQHGGAPSKLSYSLDYEDGVEAMTHDFYARPLGDVSRQERYECLATVIINAMADVLVQQSREGTMPTHPFSSVPWPVAPLRVFEQLKHGMVFTEGGSRA